MYGIKRPSGETVTEIFYPNPSVGKFMIRVGSSSYEGDKENYIIKVYDWLGRNVDARIRNLSETEYQVEIDEPTKGYYFVKMMSASGKIVNDKILIK